VASWHGTFSTFGGGEALSRFRDSRRCDGCPGFGLCLPHALYNTHGLLLPSSRIQSWRTRTLEQNIYGAGKQSFVATVGSRSSLRMAAEREAAQIEGPGPWGSLDFLSHPSIQPMYGKRVGMMHETCFNQYKRVG